MTIPHAEAIKNLLYRLADDDLIMGHRNSEWTGLGPILEEDIAFSSMAQDELGHALAYYTILHELLDENEPDQIAFNRTTEKFTCAQLTEFPIGDYAFSIARHFLYDTAEMVRLQFLSSSSFEPIAILSSKLIREEKYHVLHAKTWIKQLATGSADSRLRIQQALSSAYPMALGLFESTEFSKELSTAGIQPEESVIRESWEKMIEPILTECGLTLPFGLNDATWFGGRTGIHSSHLPGLLKEMTEVFSIDPTASW